MTKDKKIPSLISILFKGALPLSIADAASKGANVIVALLIARFFGPKIYGQYATALSVCGLFLIVTGIGFEQEFTKRGGIDSKLIAHSLQLNLIAISITSLIAYLCIVIFFSFGVYPKETIWFGIFLGIMLIASRFHLPFRHLCLLIDKLYLTAIIQSIATGIILICTFSIIYFNLKISYIIISHLLIALSFIAVWIKWTPNKYLRAKIEKKDIKKFFIKSIPFAFSNIIWIAYFNFDTFMLSLMRSEEEVGTYAAVYRIIGVNYILGYAIVNTFTPKLFRFFNLNRFMFAKIVHKLLSVVITIGIMLSCLLFLFSSFLVPFIVGDSYRNGIIVAQILSIAILFRFINFGLCEVLTTSNQQKYRVQLETVMLLINIIVNYNLIPLLGGEGAAISTVFAEIALLIGCLLICRNKKLLNTPTKAARNLIS